MRLHGSTTPLAVVSVDGTTRSFEDRVLEVLRSLRPGEIVTYGEVAIEAGSPGAARAVGNVMAHCPDDVPWWRVVTSTGRLVPGHEAEQRRRLTDEGVAETLIGASPGATGRRTGR